MNRRKFLLGTAAAPAMAVPLPARSGIDEFGPPDLPEVPTDAHDEKYWHALRWHFYIPRGHAYCNTGTLGATPKTAIHAVNQHQIYVEQNLSSEMYGAGEPTFLGGYQDEPTLRTRLGAIIGADMTEVALTRNATMGMSYVAMGLQLEAGDEVVMTDQEHPGGRCAYDVRAKRDGIKVIEVPVSTKDPKAIVTAFRAAITERTKVLAIPHVTSVLGLRLPIEEIARMAKAKNPEIFVVVDGAQSLGQIAVDVKKLGCDAFFSSPHKWLLAPKGSGMLYVAKQGNERIWTTIASSQWDFQADVGRRFSQIGTGNQSLHKGFEASLDLLERVGLKTIYARIKTLGDQLRSGLAEIDGVTIRSSVHPDMCAGISNFAIRGWRVPDIVKHLWEADQITTRPAADGVRQCLHIYTTRADVERTLARVRTMASKRG